ncbi:kinase domain protein (macronuclear) [Tetrahymena thermophila SB210]|uniref:non-specific serine/threonine protein kinase n=1 Tax=Tetrahymena thermophila (strain SB210) TaxID=312017 RepID=I7LVB7_TETTS|nr:kinase domain protein [Tetrahymena thermophila SB210]EAR97822.2 kinase domain protein [Tetrahymena thermophila SB210]|eukprot:XP_001018067.2 kinase domain protein [Tetrahymena thermophila SB210]
MGCVTSKTNDNAISRKKPEKVITNKRKIEDNTSSFWDTQSQNNGLQQNTDKDECTISSIENIYYYYKFLKKLGNGAFGSVMLAQQTKPPFNKVAIKIIDKKSVKGTPSFYLKREVDIIKQLDHPNICRFLETYMDKDHIYLVMEYLSGGTLRDKFINKEELTEYQISQVMQKLFYAINYLHTRNIVHRDLKLENVVYTSTDENAEIKIIDFGLSKKLNVRSSRKRHTKVGSAYYMAPEVLLHEKYERECDMWSLGVMMYFLLSRELPFEDLDQIEQGKFNFDAPVWNYVSDEAKDMIRNILLVNTKKRLKLSQALDHKWFQMMNKLKQNNEKPKNLPVPHRSYTQLVEKLVQFRMENQFRREVLMIMVKRISPNENITPKNLFRNIDKDQNGVITADELRLCLYELGYKDIQNVDQLLHKICGNNKQENLSLKQGVQETNYINYSEFIAATLDESTYLNKTKLQQIFHYLNSTETGYITQEDLKDIMAREGRKLSENKMKEIQLEMEEFCSEAGKLNFDDFCKAMGFEQFKTQLELIEGNEIHLSHSARSIPGEKDVELPKKSIPVLPLQI